MSCITLLSDFGLHDASVAIARGVLMQHAPTASLIDISHEVTPYQAGQAAYLLSSAYRNFPEGTIHVLLFDLFSDVTPRLILSGYKGHYFLSPDNGILPTTLGTIPDSWLCMELAKTDSFTDWLHAAGRTIKDLTNLSTNQPINQLTNQLSLQPHTMKAGIQSQPLVAGDEAVCEVLHIDHYENVVTNMTRQQFETLRNGRRFRLQFMLVEEITEVSNHYHDVREGFKLCRFNSNDYLEICINRGGAASLFGLRLGSKYNDIKIFFE